MAAWIRGDGDNARWHLGDRVATAHGSTAWAMRCTGIKLYSPWGVTVWNGSGPPSEIEYALCKRCAKKGA